MSIAARRTGAGLRPIILTLGLTIFLLVVGTMAQAAEVIIVGDTRLQPVVTVVAGISETLKRPAPVYSLADIDSGLEDIVADEQAKTVIALGRDAINLALQLPPAITVIYDLVITPPPGSRPNTTGLYMGTPVEAYLDLIRKYLPAFRNISVVGSNDLLRTLGSRQYSLVTTYNASNPSEFVDTIKQLNSTDAILLLPDISLLTASSIRETYLFSFRTNVPLLGISEKNVRQGALFALVFDPLTVGRQLGELAAKSLAGADLGRIPPSPPSRYELYINKDTAKKMGIILPEELLKIAKNVYP